MCRRGHLLHGSVECALVRLGGTSKATQLADELYGRCPNFLLCRGRFEIMERLDITAHDDPRLTASGASRNEAISGIAGRTAILEISRLQFSNPVLVHGRELGAQI